MPVWEGLGANAGGSYSGWSDYTDAVAAVEDPKWIPMAADAFPRMRCTNDYFTNGNLSDTVYPNISTTNLHRWILKVKAYKPSLYIMYGHAGNQGTVTDYPEYSQYKPSGYLRQRAYMLAEAQWAQDNGMDAFSVNNECLISAAHASVGMIPTSITRTSNVATATFSYDHGLTTGDYIFVAAGTTADYRVADSESAETVQCTVTGARTMTYPSTGADGTAAGSYRVNWSAYEKVRKIKADIVAAQAVFTRGIVLYNESQGHSNPWIQLGLPDGAYYGHNGYGTAGVEATTAGYSSWKTEIDALYAAFGDKLIVTEFNCVLDGTPNTAVGGLTCDQRGFEREHEKEIWRRYQYIRNSLPNISQVYYFSSMQGQMSYNTWPSREYGNRYFRGDFRPIYNILREEPVDRVFLGSGAFDGSSNYWG